MEVEGPATEAAAAGALTSERAGSQAVDAQVPVSVLPPAKNEKGTELRARVAANKYDAEAWADLAQEAQDLPVSEASTIYEQLLAAFPTAAQYWRQYAEAHMDVGDDDAVRSVFSRCLPTLRDIQLWRSYLRYITLTNEDRGGPGYEDIRKAYDFSLGYIGQDISAAPVWQDYLSFIKKTAGALLSDEAKTAGMLGKVYQAAVVIPMHGVEALWREYEAFENEVHKQTAKAALGEFQPRHGAAKAVLLERKKLTDELSRPALPVPPKGTLREAYQVAAWKQLLAFERGNPQRLEPAVLSSRVTFAHEQCVMYLYHYADPWFQYAERTGEHSSPTAAAAIFQRALKAVPGSTPLHLGLAELEELRGNVGAAKAVYKALLDREETASALVRIQMMRFVQRTEGIEAARKVFLAATKAPTCTYHVYLASAKLELAANKGAQTARNIFEYGLKKYIQEPEYVLQYVDFLQQQNDDRNVRVLFERALNVLPTESAPMVWSRFVDFEAAHGDLATLLKVERRRREALKDSGEHIEEGLEALVRRYRFMDLWPASPQELAFIRPTQAVTAESGLPSGRLENGDAEEQAKLAGTSENGRTDSHHNASTAQGHPSRKHVQQQRRTPPRPPPGPPPEAASHPPPPPPLPPGLPPNASFVSRPSSTPPVPVPQFLVDALVQQLPAIVLDFLGKIPPLQGPSPDVDMVMAALLSANFSSPPEGLTAQADVGDRAQPAAGGASAGNKRKQPDPGQEDEPVNPSRPPPRDVFRLRQLQRAKAAGALPGGTSSAGTVSTSSRSGSH